MTALELAQQLKAKFGERACRTGGISGRTHAEAGGCRAGLPEVCSFAKAELGFDFLVDITSLDNYGDDPRWTIVYHLYGIGHRVLSGSRPT